MADDPYKLKPDSPSRVPWVFAILCFLGAAGAVGWHLIDKEKGRTELMQAHNAEADAKKKLADLEKKLADLEEERKKEAEEAKKLAEQMASKEATEAQNEKLIADLKAKVDSKEGDVTNESGRITVNLVDRILFKSGDADLSPRGKEILTKVGGVLKELKDKQILIGGHTDNVPIHTDRFGSNWELSTARAVTVVRHLSETAGVDASRLVAAGYSQYHPRSKKDKAKNRRIEILLTPLVDVKKLKKAK